MLANPSTFLFCGIRLHYLCEGDYIRGILHSVSRICPTVVDYPRRIFNEVKNLKQLLPCNEKNIYEYRTLLQASQLYELAGAF